MKPASSAPIVALGEILWDLLPSGPRAGGAPFNFAFHCHQLGHPAVIVSRVGDDELGRELRAEVRRLGMSDEYIQTDSKHPTGTVRVELDQNGQPTYTITENVAWDYLEWQAPLDALAKSARGTCYGSLAQRHEVGRETIRKFVNYDAASGLRLCDINLRPPFVSDEVVSWAVRRADWLKLNHEEGPDVLRPIGEPWVQPQERTDKSAAASPLADLLLAATGCDLVCVTRGADGCVVRVVNSAIVLPGIRVQIADTVGAGDAFTAALLTQHLEGKPLAEAARFANAYAAVVASKPGGTPIVNRAEVERLL